MPLQDRPSPPRDAALEHLAERYARLIRSVVARVGGRTAESAAGDVAQEVLLALWNRIQGEQTIDHPASYVYRAAVRETVRLLRRTRARAEEPLVDALDGVPSVSPWQPRPVDPDEAMCARETRETIEGCLSRLSPERSQAVRAHLAGFDAQEIMDIHGWEYQKTRNLIARGMADLRRCLSAKGIHD